MEEAKIANPFEELLGENRPLRIFNVPWHIAHQYELFKIPFTEWFHVVNPIRRWGKYRPTPGNLHMIPYYEPGKCDVAVLHVDQQCVDETIGKARLYAQLNKIIKDIPKIIINHGTPYWPEVYEKDHLITRMKMLMAGNHVVFNSHRAKEMWEEFGPMGKSSRTIIHGMDPDEWKDDQRKEPIVFTTLSAGGLGKYYNRTLLLSVKEKLAERGIKHVWVGEECVFEFDDYREFVSKGLVYFNPTLESPMPRSRTEAMLSGACVVTLPNHGAEDFIKQGLNGFLVPNNPETIAEFIEDLITKHYRKALEIGRAGKATARTLFNGERFRIDWTRMLQEVLVAHGKK